MKIADLKQVFFIGIGGIGMSALARYFHHLNIRVAGYDKTETALTKQLTQEGIQVFYDDSVENIAFAFTRPVSEYAVIYTPAVPTDLALMTFFKKLGCHLYKRSEVLGFISQSHYTLAVAGTHGKTTTSTMIAHMLTDSGYGCAAFLGGIAANYGSNVLFSSSNTLVVEADEFDRSFLTLHPDIAIVTSTDADHLDVYENADGVVESFRLFINQVSSSGVRIVKQDLDLPADIYYSITREAGAFATNIRIENNTFYFDYHNGDEVITHIELGIPGRHNVENAVAAITAVRQLGVGAACIKQALASFRGVKRRFEYIVNRPGCVYIDDYAHHPTELTACLTAVRELFQGEQITCVFQPHLFSRTRDFAHDFAAALALTDVLLLMDIYPAREEPLPGIDADWLLEKIAIPQKFRLSPSEILDYIRTEKPRVLLTVGAGNIDLLVEPIKEILSHVG